MLAQLTQLLGLTTIHRPITLAPSAQRRLADTQHAPGLGRTLRKWKDAHLAYFDTAGASNGPTEAINGIIELGRRTARGYPNPTNYQLRMLLIAGGLDASTHTQL